MHRAFRGVSVVVCAKDEERRIEACLASLAGQGAVEVIVVDGASADATASIARRMGATVIVSTAGSLAADRQLGADFASGSVIAFVDADHRLPPFALHALADALDRMGVDVAQAGLVITPRSFWNRAESDFLAVTHNRPGVRTMVGTAPAAFRACVLHDVRFADVGGIDDTDYMARLHRDTAYRVAVADVVVEQEHEPSLRSYVRKWRWYGLGDRAYCKAHRDRAASMRFHLLIRYPLVHPARALLARRPRAAVYALAQGVVRAWAAFVH